MISSESRALVLILLDEVFNITKNSYKYCFYDNGCHLDESLQTHIDKHPILKDLIIKIDRFHLKNHTRKVKYTCNLLILSIYIKL